MNLPPPNAPAGCRSAPPSDLEWSIRSALSAARTAQCRWAATPLSERLARVRELRHRIAGSAELLARSSGLVRQRPLAESLAAEVMPLAESCRFLEREAESLLTARRVGRRRRPLWLTGVRSEIRREPFGVVLIIGPGNYPLFLPGVQLIQALVAGNAALLKPGPGGSEAARVLIDLMRQAGFDAQLMALLPESTEAACLAMEAQPDKVVFTGAAGTGQEILAQLAPRLIPATVELSGCDAVIVRADADLDLVARALKFGLTLNGGATCMAPRRVFVHRSVATELEGRLTRFFASLQSRGSAGRPLHDEETIQPGRLATGLAETLVTEAVVCGAHFVVGGLTAAGRIQLPAILAGINPAARLLRADLFAPVLTLVTIGDDAEAIARVNDCPYALGASVFTGDELQGRAIAARLDAGVVTVNDIILPTADARVPFGGRRRSGFGVTRGPEGLLELTCPKVVTVSRSRHRPAFAPSRSQDEAMFQAYLKFTHGRGLKLRAEALLALFKAFFSRQDTTRNPTT